MTPALSAAPGTLAPSLALQGAHAISSGPPAAFFDPGFLLLVVPFGVVFALIQRRRHREAPLRREMRARPTTFSSSVDVQLSFLGNWGSLRGIPLLAVHGDVFEVSDLFPPARWLLGMQYCYRASDTTMEAVPGRRHDWIEIAGLPAAERESSKVPVPSRVRGNHGGPIGGVVAGFRTLSPADPTRIRIGRRRMNREIWDALVRAGANPGGAPPQ